jgi:hypothetical protein
MRANLSLAFELSPLGGHQAPLSRKVQKLLLDFSVLHLAGTQFALLRPGAIFFGLGHDRRPFVRYMVNTSGQQSVPPGRWMLKQTPVRFSGEGGYLGLASSRRECQKKPPLGGGAESESNVGRVFSPHLS